MQNEEGDFSFESTSSPPKIEGSKQSINDFVSHPQAHCHTGPEREDSTTLEPKPILSQDPSFPNGHDALSSLGIQPCSRNSIARSDRGPRGFSFSPLQQQQSQQPINWSSHHLEGGMNEGIELLLSGQQQANNLHLRNSLSERSRVSETTRSVFDMITSSNDSYDIYDSAILDEIRFDVEKSDISTENSHTHRRKKLKELIRMEFPEGSFPSAGKTIETCIHNSGARKDGAKYCPGDWVEIRGTDMKWRLVMVTRVLKHAPDDWDWNDPENGNGKKPNWIFFYHAGKQRMLEGNEIRASQEGLRRLFGYGPWVWQQWACLKLEHEIRFQEGHQDDFVWKDVRKYAAELWNRWLNDRSNVAFKNHFYDPRVGEIGRRELIDHIMTPFELIDDMTEDTAGSDWSFEDENFSVYTYLSLLGTGFFMAFVTFALQIIIPVMLWPNKEETEPNETKDANKLGDIQSITNVMICAIIILYIVKVIPDTWDSFYNTVGHADTAYSRVQSLREELWSQGEESFGQMVGYLIERYMNTAYNTVLYMFNMYILTQTNEAFEVLLNALAVEFLVRLDESFVASKWWDRDKRWIMAGANELVIRNTLRLEWLKSSYLFSVNLGIPQELLNDICDEDENLFRNERLALKDSGDMEFMTKREAINYECAQISLEDGNDTAMSEYHKPSVHFRLWYHSLFKCFRNKSKAIFDKFGAYRTWSRWDRVLYVCAVPDLDCIFDEEAEVKEELMLIEPTHNICFANFNPKDCEIDHEQAFMRHFIGVLTFRYMIRSLLSAWKEKDYLSFSFRIIDGFLRWAAYFVQIIFPLWAFYWFFQTAFFGGKP